MQCILCCLRALAAPLLEFSTCFKCPANTSVLAGRPECGSDLHRALDRQCILTQTQRYVILAALTALLN